VADPQTSGTLTPFTLPRLISQQRTPLTKSPAMTFPHAQLRIPDEPRSTRARNTRHRDASEERDTLVEVVQCLQGLQERVAYLEGRSSGERERDRRLQRMSTAIVGEDPFGSEGTSDAPPTYRSYNP
jgi:hypothetical protein